MAFFFVLLFFCFKHLIIVYGVPETVFSISSSTYQRYRIQDFKCVPNANCSFSCMDTGFIGGNGISSHSCSSNPGSSYSRGGCSCSTISCSDGGYNCFVSCGTDNSCRSNTINCGDNSQCDIYCSGNYSCYGANIYCGSNSKCNVYCRGNAACKYAKFNVGENSFMHLNCNGGESCRYGDYNCGVNAECHIDCEAYGQFGATNINYECADININAANSNKLSIDIYNGLYAAQNMIVYAPNTDVTSPTIIKCGINTHSSALTQYSCDKMKIYADEGWNDVQLQLNWMDATNMFADYTSGDQQMFCGETNQYFCYGWLEDIVESDMLCHDDIVICNNRTIIPTNDPSEHPTIQPSESPSKTPSDLPSKLPSDSPSKLPTKSPNKSSTDNPSNSPSVSLSTSSPSKSPAKSPTASQLTSKSPSQSPSQSPTTSPETSYTDDIQYDYSLTQLCIVLFLIHLIFSAN